MRHKGWTELTGLNYAQCNAYLFTPQNFLYCSLSRILFKCCHNKYECGLYSPFLLSFFTFIPFLISIHCRCGAQFTSKMEGMLNDLSIGTDTSRAFGEFVRTNPEAKTSLGKMEFSVQVCGYRLSHSFDRIGCTALPWRSPSLPPSLPPFLLTDLCFSFLYYTSRCWLRVTGRRTRSWTWTCPLLCRGACSSSSSTTTWR